MRCVPIVLLFACLAMAADHVTAAKAVVAAANRDGGLCVVLGAGDGGLALALAAHPGFAVHALARDAAAVQATRAAILAKGVYGRVACERWTASALPHADDLVSLLVVVDAGGIGEDELRRVVSPGGAIVRAQDSLWKGWTKPRPSTLDEWTHPHHDAARTNRSLDQLAGQPQVLQWDAAPTYQTTPVVAADGLLFARGVDTAVAASPENVVTARDAWSGVPRWRRTLRFEWQADTKNERPYIHGWSTAGEPTRAHDSLVAAGGRLYATTFPHASVLDARTGKDLATLSTAAPPFMLAVDGGIVAVATAGAVEAFDAGTHQARWRRPCTPLDLTLADGRVHYLDLAVMPYDLVAIDAAKGTEIWRISTREWFNPDWQPAKRGVPQPPVRLHSCDNGRLIVVGKRQNLRWKSWEADRLAAIAAADGKVLWQRRLTAEQPGWMDINGMALSGGLFWVSSERNKTGIDPATGADAKVVHPMFGMNDNCQYTFSTDRMVAFKGTYWMNAVAGKAGNDPYRLSLGHAGPCGSHAGLLANGLSYLGSKECPCTNSGNSLRAGFPIERAKDPALTGDGETRHEPGPEAAPAGATAPDLAREWPAYCGSAARSAANRCALPVDLRPLWQAAPAPGEPGEWTQAVALGARISAPVVAGGVAVIADCDSHTLRAFHAATGKPAWTFTTGGRLDSAPAIGRGLCVVGCRDGWVYALRLADGKQVWRTRLARSDRRIGSYGQVESTWPVIGSVVVHGDRVGAMAGRFANYAGRVWQYGLDLATGAVVWSKRRVTKDHYTIERPTFLAATAGGTVYQLGDNATHRALGARLRLADGAPADKEAADGYAPVWCPLTLPHRRYRLRSTLGQGEAYDGTRVFKFTGQWSHQENKVFVLAPAAAVTFPQAKSEPLRTHVIPGKGRIQAIAVAGDTLLVAGSNDAFDDRAGGYLLRFGAADGAPRGRHDLAQPPAFQGMAIADDRLYISLVDGTLACFGR